MRRPAVPLRHPFHRRNPRHHQACASLLAAGLLGFALLAQAVAAPNDKPRAPVYRCEGGGTATFSDTPKRCPTGQGTSDQTAARSASGVDTSGPTSRISRSGPPCPLAARNPEGPAWAGLKQCYSRYLDTQPDRVAPEAQLAGAAMGECETDTTRLANGKDHVDELGITPLERRQAIRLWTQWLVRSLGKAIDSMPVDSVRAGRPAAISRLSGPLEQQWPDGSVTEATNGTLVPPGSQVYVRRGVSLFLGGSFVPAQTKQDRCVRVD